MILNRDLTKESIVLYVTKHQIYARVFARNQGRWCTQTYLKAYTFDIDQELVKSTIKEIVRMWKLHNPKVTVHK